MSLARDLQLARRAKKHGAEHSLRIVWEARRAGIPISLAFAVVEQESGFQNVFGHDHGGMYPGLSVTKERVAGLIRALREHRGANGVGLTQLTWPPFVYAAERLGGAHLPKNQLRVGFGHLSDLIRHYGTRDGLAAYNAGGPHNRMGQHYARLVLDKRDKWHRFLS